MNVVRAISSEGFGRIEYHTMIRGLLDTDPSVRGFMEGETDRAARVLPRPDPHASWDRCTSTSRRAG